MVDFIYWFQRVRMTIHFPDSLQLHHLIMTWHDSCMGGNVWQNWISNVHSNGSNMGCSRTIRRWRQRGKCTQT